MTSPIPSDDLARLFFAQQTNTSLDAGRLLPAVLVAWDGTTHRNTVALLNSSTTYTDLPILFGAVGYMVTNAFIVVMTTSAKPIIIDALTVPS